MQDESQDLITLFNERYTTNNVKVMKILHSGLPRERQADFACLIRCMELQSLQFSGPPINACSNSAPDTVSLLTACLPYLDAQLRSSLEQALEMLRTFEFIQDMMKTMELMKDLFPDSSDHTAFTDDMIMQLFGDNSFDINSILHTMQEGKTENDGQQTEMDDG